MIYNWFSHSIYADFQNINDKIRFTFFFHRSCISGLPYSVGHNFLYFLYSFILFILFPQVLHIRLAVGHNWAKQAASTKLEEGHFPLYYSAHNEQQTITKESKKNLHCFVDRILWFFWRNPMYKVYFWFESIFFFRANSKLTQISYPLSPTQVENELKWRKCPMWGYFSSQIVTNGTWVERLPQSLSPPNYLRICGLQLKIAEEGGLGNQTKVKKAIWTSRLGCRHFSSFNIF